MPERITDPRQFSKEFLPEKRKSYAREIKKQRSNYFKGQKEMVTRDNARIEEETEKKRKEILYKLESAAKSLKDAEETLAKARNRVAVTLLDKIAAPFVPSRLFKITMAKNATETIEIFEPAVERIKQEIIQNESELGKIDENKDIALAAAAGLREETKDRSGMLEARRLLAEYHGVELKELSAYLNEKEARNLSQLIEKEQAFVLHGCVLNNGWSAYGSPLGKNVDWDTKIKTILALQPTISTFPFKQGMEKITWADQGVVLKGGSVEDISFGEVTRVNPKTGVRKKRSDVKFSNIPNQFRDAVSRRAELVVENPQAAGLYFTRRSNHISEVIEFAKEYSIPLFIYSDDKGEMRRFVDNIQEPNKFPIVSPEDILKSDFVLSPENRKELVDELINGEHFVGEHVDRVKEESKNLLNSEEQL